MKRVFFTPSLRIKSEERSLKSLQLYEYNRPQINQYFLLILPGCGNNFSHTHSSAKCKKTVHKKFKLRFRRRSFQCSWSNRTPLHSSCAAVSIQAVFYAVICPPNWDSFVPDSDCTDSFHFSPLLFIYHIIISMLYIITSFPNCYTAIILDPAHCCWNR